MEGGTKVCPNCGEENPSKAKFCLECATSLQLISPSEERRLVTVLFADLSGFTAYSEKADVENVKALAHDASARLGEIVERYGGVVDKVIGDAVMAVFGAPISHEDDAERAVRAALDMHSYVTENSDRFEKLELTIGLNTGEAMYAPVGPGGNYTVIGDTVNTAARLQSAAGRGEVLVGQQTFEASEASIDFEAVPPIKAKNKAEPVLAWRATSVKGVVPRRAVSKIPLIGRSTEFDRIWELWERVRVEKRPYVAYLLGSPGIGKSRLINEMAGRIQGAAEVLWGRCLSYGEGITYWPIIEMIKQAAGIIHTDESDEVSSKLGALLEDLGSENLDELRSMAIALANLVAAPRTPRGTYRAEEISKGELHWGVRKVFQLLSAKRPLVIVLEDLHWAEPTLFELIGFLQGGDENFPLLVLASARPELKETTPEILALDRCRRVIELKPLQDQESKALVGELAARLGFSESEAEPLIAASGGNPLFIEETVRMLTETADGGPIKKVPRTLHSLISSRLDRLPSTEKRVAQQASVVGTVFWPGAVRYITDNGTGVEATLESLSEREVVLEQEKSSVQGEREFSFRHNLIKDVAYDQLPKRTRADLHSRCGKWVSSLPGGDDEFAEIIAFHYEEACKLIRDVAAAGERPPVLEAVRALTRAAEKAEGRQGTREAARFYERALALADETLPETMTDLHLRHSKTLTALGRVQDATKELTLVVSGSLEVGRPDLRGGALLGLASIAMAQGRPTQARDQLREATRMSSDLGNRSLQIRCAFGMATLRARFEASVAEAVEELQLALRIAESSGERLLEMEGHLRLGTILFNVGHLAKSADHFSKCTEIAREEGSLRNEAGATQFLGLVKFYLGEEEEAEALTLQSLTWFERTADQYLQAQNLRSLAKFALARREYEQAEQWLREALSLATEIGGWLVVEIYRYLAESLAAQGRIQEARTAADAARSSLAAEENPYGEAAVKVAEGFVAWAEKDEVATRQAFTTAFPLIEKAGYEIDLAEVRLAFAGILKALGDHAGARNELEAAGELFVNVGATGMIDEVDTHLRELSETGSQ
ncbi:MAG: AAA family ATPase [Actinobacteria bacterium]|nr:AAA family ATPase [Actinomycetota bacterium]